MLGHRVTALCWPRRDVDLYLFRLYSAIFAYRWLNNPVPYKAYYEDEVDEMIPSDLDSDEITQVCDKRLNPGPS